MEKQNSAGKLPPQLCKNSFLRQHGANRPEVQVGPRQGVDVAIVQLTDTLGMALTSDPLSLIPTLGLQESAWLSVQLMANDMATTGHAPQYAQFVLNLPTTLTDEDYTLYWSYIHRYCKQLGVSITGGHSGRIEGQHSTIAGGGTMITVAPLATLRTSNLAQAGHQLIVIGEAAIISTAIMARSFPTTLQNAIGHELWQQAYDLFYKSSSVAIALELAQRHPELLVAMHDVTEGGIMGAIQEMAIASHNSVEINQDALPIGLAQSHVMAYFGIDPLYCVGTGALIAAVRPEGVHSVIATARQLGYTAVHAGQFLASSQPSQRWTEGKSYPLLPLQDPYWDAFYKALANSLS